MTAATVNGLRTLTAAEEKAVGLRARGIPDTAIGRETALSPEQIDAAVQRHTVWVKLRGEVAAKQPEEPARLTISALLSWAENSGQARAMTLAARIRAQLAELRGIRDRDDERAAAAAEVERLAAELEAAKTRLKEVGGKSKTQPQPTGRRPPGTAPSPERKARLDAVRTWAREQGYDIADLGRIPGWIQDKYDAAHGGAAA